MSETTATFTYVRSSRRWAVASRSGSSSPRRTGARALSLRGIPRVDPPLRVRHAALEAEAEQRIDVDRHAAEVDVQVAGAVARLDDRVLGPGCHADRLRPPLGEGLTHAPPIDDHLPAEAPHHLQVRVAAHEDRRLDAVEERFEIGVGCGREDPIRERLRRAVIAVHDRVVAEVEVERRDERRDELVILRREETGPPRADLIEHRSQRVVRRREAVLRPRVPVPEDDGATESADNRKALVSLGAEADIAEADDLIDALAL